MTIILWISHGFPTDVACFSCGYGTIWRVLAKFPGSHGINLQNLRPRKRQFRRRHMLTAMKLPQIVPNLAYETNMNRISLPFGM